jgi:(E)-4-hydroxy-3-methylbut-2-enyl-diphosphate synthase
MKNYGDRDQVKKARELRSNMTKAEIILWSRIRSKQIEGYKFRRQQPLFNYIVDFYCFELKLIIEVDGPIHSNDETKKYDFKRDNVFKTNGYHILRLTNSEVETNIASATKKIKLFISRISSPSQGDHRGSETNQNQNNTRILSPSQGDRRGSDEIIQNTRNSSPSQGDHRGSSYMSKSIYIGSIPLGGNNPIRLQSMTNTDTLDTKASVAQCIRIIEAGADYVRLTAQGIKEAENLANIKNELRKAGFSTPLIADIHFNPAAAETAARLVEKVRINPGNYADKRASFEKQELTEKEYYEELERTHIKLLPLINICRENKTVIRLGINHGSLSDRIMTRFGNTPAGMVASAMEFIKIFRAENFNDLVLSMKSSDTAIMIESTRMLVSQMQAEGLSYPLHLGVTEAGEGEDGRIRSAAGIGALLSEGIGDTIRVSLSEDPEKEIPVAKKLAEYYPRGVASAMPEKPVTYKAPSVKPDILKKINGPVVIANMTPFQKIEGGEYLQAGFSVNKLTGEVKRTDGSADLIIAKEPPDLIPEDVFLVLPYKKWFEIKEKGNVFPLFSPETYHERRSQSEKLNILLTGSHYDIRYLLQPDPEKILVMFTFHPDKEQYAPHKFLNDLTENNLNHHIILNPVFREDNLEDLQIKAAALLGRYATDKRVAGISVTNTGAVPFSDVTALAFSILQCTETRITRTMYLSCPTCGRTKFNLQDAVKKVKEATGHLKGLKIAVMGCIVNGPGEMAGSDYGYVGAAAGKVHIYRGTVPVLKNIPEEEAVAELLQLIEKDKF